jgi:hypothetical protein
MLHLGEEPSVNENSQPCNAFGDQSLAHEKPRFPIFKFRNEHKPKFDRESEYEDFVGNAEFQIEN